MSLVFGSRILTVYEYEDGILKALESVYHGWHRYLSNKMVRAPLQTLLMAVLLVIPVAFIQLLGLSLAIFYLFGPLFCIVASGMHFDQRFYHGVKGTDDDGTRVKAALEILYILALVQAVLFYIWLVFFWTEPRRVAKVNRQLKFGRWGRSLVQRYLRETKVLCAKDFASPDSWNLVTFAVTLMASDARDDQISGARILDTFVGHQQQDIHVLAGPAIRLYLLSSQRCISNLIAALGWRGHDHIQREIRERATRIVADVAGDISITQFPEALQCISSLLDCTNAQQGQGTMLMHEKSAVVGERKMVSRVTKSKGPTLPFYIIYEAKLKATEHQDKDCHGTSFVPRGPEELVLNGLLILERIAHSEGNCRAMCNDDALLKRIMAPMNSLALTNATYFSDMAVDVLDRSMRVVSRLISAPGDASRSLRLQIASNADVVRSMMETLQGDSISGNLKARAMEILTEIALFTDSNSKCKPNETKAQFVRILLSVFLGDRNDAEIVDTGLRKKAGESLARLLSVETVSDSMVVLLLEMLWVSEPVCAQTMRQNDSVVHQLSELLAADTIYCRICAAEILENLCYHSSKRHERYNESFITLLPKVVEQILCTETEAETNAEVEANTCSAPISDVENQCSRDNANPNSSSADRNHEEQEKRRLLSSLLSLTLVICNSLAGAGGDFPCVLQKAFPGDDSFVKKLKHVLETNSCATVDCLRILKITSHVVILVAQHIPGYIRYLEEHKFVESLSTTLGVMSGTECCMLFSNGCQQRMKPFRSLYYLVKETRDMAHESEATAA